MLAGDGLTALRMAQQHMPDLLVSDVGMPGMDGLELTRRFRELPGNRLAPVVLLTAFAQPLRSPAGLRRRRARLRDSSRSSRPSCRRACARSWSCARWRCGCTSRRSWRRSARSRPGWRTRCAIRPTPSSTPSSRSPSCLPAELRQEDHPVAQLVGVMRECATQIALLSRQLLGFRRPGELEYQHTTVADVVARAHALTSPLFKTVELREELDYNGRARLRGAAVDAGAVEPARERRAGGRRRRLGRSWPRAPTTTAWSLEISDSRRGRAGRRCASASSSRSSRPSRPARARGSVSPWRARSSSATAGSSRCARRRAGRCSTSRCRCARTGGRAQRQRGGGR